MRDWGRSPIAVDIPQRTGARVTVVDRAFDALAEKHASSAQSTVRSKQKRVELVAIAAAQSWSAMLSARFLCGNRRSERSGRGRVPIVRQVAGTGGIQGACHDIEGEGQWQRLRGLVASSTGR